jgi:hypothetical protein
MRFTINSLNPNIITWLKKAEISNNGTTVIMCQWNDDPIEIWVTTSTSYDKVATCNTIDEAVIFANKLLRQSNPVFNIGDVVYFGPNKGEVIEINISDSKPIVCKFHVGSGFESAFTIDGSFYENDFHRSLFTEQEYLKSKNYTK